MHWAGSAEWLLVFFFRGEDGIRADLVTGVQTCALPLSRRVVSRELALGRVRTPPDALKRELAANDAARVAQQQLEQRSEERRGGKEGRAGRGPEHGKKNKEAMICMDAL